MSTRCNTVQRYFVPWCICGKLLYCNFLGSLRCRGKTEYQAIEEGRRQPRTEPKIVRYLNCFRNVGRFCVLFIEGNFFRVLIFFVSEFMFKLLHCFFLGLSAEGIPKGMMTVSCTRNLVNST